MTTVSIYPDEIGLTWEQMRKHKIGIREFLLLQYVVSCIFEGTLKPADKDGFWILKYATINSELPVIHLDRRAKNRSKKLYIQKTFTNLHNAGVVSFIIQPYEKYFYLKISPIVLDGLKIQWKKDQDVFIKNYQSGIGK